ncbi:hypothetical protein O7599_27270 [Streptomyces sp. WMMC500]|uniref:hypothetical protein n=1 Tax=Streptomyces sp. WMMC500 TaxID=3015154 RepID=UPI00248CFED5|nr:hypothetical protein [Streptomyces sp. WMMC500]WBB59257.1 hypothetical protein O7599_27270 [Streptomyces sp. WMMC500]
MENVLPGVVGALIGLAGVLLGASATGRSEDRRWLREQKLKSAADMITAGLHLYEAQVDGSDQRRLTTADRVEWQDRLQTGRSHIHLLCGAETRAAADGFAGLAWRKEGSRNVPDQADVVRALREFNRHLRREIRSDGPERRRWGAARR